MKSAQMLLGNLQTGTGGGSPAGPQRLTAYRENLIRYFPSSVRRSPPDDDGGSLRTFRISRGGISAFLSSFDGHGVAGASGRRFRRGCLLPGRARVSAMVPLWGPHSATGLTAVQEAVRRTAADSSYSFELLLQSEIPLLLCRRPGSEDLPVERALEFPESSGEVT